MLFGGFEKCLYPAQRFQSDTERRFAVLLENEADVVTWFKPGKDAFAIVYRDDVVYEPDFVVETKTVSGKPWAYLLIPHDAVTGGETIHGLAAAYTMRPLDAGAALGTRTDRYIGTSSFSPFPSPSPAGPSRA